MNLNLCTIDWTAIGSIATVIAMIIAYRAIYASVKQNKDNQKFQLLLVQRDIEQKRLDELVENILIINDSIQPIVVADYSVKLIQGCLTEEDQNFIAKMAAKDDLDNNRLNIQLMKYDKKQSAKNVLVALNSLRQTYGIWVRNIFILNLCKTKGDNIPPSELTKALSTMAKISKEIVPKYEKTIYDILKTCSSDLDKAIDLLNIFCDTITTYLIENKKVFEKELLAFVKKEQSRIDNMFSHKSIK